MKNKRRAASVQESERKAYNPRPFCKTYTMDKQPLNTGEQKDMTEFFTDLITKIEEMSQELVNRFFLFRMEAEAARLVFLFERLHCLLTEKHSEDSVWRRHHQQRGVSGECEESRARRSERSVSLTVLPNADPPDPRRTVTTSARPPRSFTPSGVRWPT